MEKQWIDLQNLGCVNQTLSKIATIHQVTTMLATSKNVLFPGHNHLLTTSTDDPTLWLLPKRQRGWSLVLQTYGYKNKV